MEPGKGLTTAEWATITTSHPMKGLIEALGNELEWRKDAATAIPTGFDAWDTRLGGLFAGDLVSVVGAVGSGTSSLLLAITNSALRAGHPVIYVSCQRPASQLVERFVAVRSNVDELRLRAGHLNEKQMVRVRAAMDQVARLALYPITTRAPSAIVEAVAAVNMTNDFATPLVIIDGYEEFVAGILEAGQPSRDRILALRDAAHDMKFALVVAARLTEVLPQLPRAIHEVPEDLAHYSDVVLALAPDEDAWTDAETSTLKLTIVKHRTADPNMTRSLLLQRSGRYGWTVDHTAKVSFAKSLRPIWPPD